MKYLVMHKKKSVRYRGQFDFDANAGLEIFISVLHSSLLQNIYVKFNF